MEWLVPVNDILKHKITKLNYTLIPPGFYGSVRGVRVMQESLSKMIDMLGEQSATAQGLKKVITTAEKLRNSPSNVLYLLKDASAKDGKGDVIGLLKVGRKHLFLFDEKDKVCEVEPLCVLDFFVVKKHQRHGYGKILFNYMLQDMDVSAKELAIDGPSPKIEQFLKKNYGMERLLRQNNNFAVSPQFFENMTEMNKSGRSTPMLSPPVGRFSAPKRQSSIASVIHGGSNALQQTSNGKSAGANPEAEIEGEANPVADKEAEPAVKQKNPERPSTLHVEPVSEAPPSAPALLPAGSVTSRRVSQITDRGYFDVKFYHNKLW